MAGETLSQFGQARQFLGNRATGQNLGIMQNVLQRTGTSISDQAQAAETITGATRGGTFQGGVLAQVEILRKGVAAGMDASKSGQFLRITSEFIAQSMGLGQIDVDSISNAMRDLTAAAAGGGDVSRADMERARNLQEQLRRESTGTAGFAGLGNVLGFLDAIPEPTTGQFLAGQNLSANATVEDTMEILGVDRQTAEKVVRNKKNALSLGLGAAFGEGKEANMLKLGLGGRETGQTSEQFLGRQRMIKGQQGVQGLRDQLAEGVGGGALAPGMLDLVGGTKALPQGAFGSAEFESQRAEAEAEQIELKSGMLLLLDETDLVRTSFGKLKTDLENASTALKDFMDDVKLNNQTQ